VSTDGDSGFDISSSANLAPKFINEIRILNKANVVDPIEGLFIIRRVSQMWRTLFRWRNSRTILRA
jgi:hypothetical protein